MKKLIVTSIVAALAVGALVAPAEAGKKKKKPPAPRTAEGTYSQPALGVPGVVGSAALGGAYEFATLTNENYIQVEIDDTAGGSPTFTMSQDTDPSTPTYEIFGTWCGTTGDEPVAITPGLPVRVSVYTTPGPDQPTCTGPATSGTIKATFTQ